MAGFEWNVSRQGWTQLREGAETLKGAETLIGLQWVLPLATQGSQCLDGGCSRGWMAFRVLDRELSLGHRGRKRQILPLFRFSGGSGLQSAGPGCRVCGSWGLPSSLCPCPPQATYVLLALAWVFVPIYISSEVSLLPGTQGGLACIGALLPWLGDADEQEPRLHVVEPAHCSQGCVSS